MQGFEPGCVGKAKAISAPTRDMSELDVSPLRAMIQPFHRCRAVAGDGMDFRPQ